MRFRASSWKGTELARIGVVKADTGTRRFQKRYKGYPIVNDLHLLRLLSVFGDVLCLKLFKNSYSCFSNFVFQNIGRTAENEAHKIHHLSCKIARWDRQRLEL
jgi:hypothetical protein